MRTSDQLEEFVGMEFGTTLDQITEPKTVGLMILRLIQWAETKGKLTALLESSLESFGQNADVGTTVPPLLEKMRDRGQVAANRVRIQQTGALDLTQLTENLGELVKLLQQMAPAADPKLAQQALEAGTRAMGKLKNQGDTAELTADERTGLDAIIFATSRPALLVQKGDFSQPPDQWRELLGKREGLRRAIAATGRIETPNNSFPWVGTGFLVAPDVLATATYVGTVAAKRQGDKWVVNRKIGARVNFLQEYGSKESAAFDLKSVIGTDDKLGIMLFELSGKGAPPPIPLCGGKEPKAGQAVCLVGYPAQDSRRPDDFLRSVLGNIFEVKRLCPGRVMRVDGPSVIEHDCSSSGGMGGAPLVDVETGSVLALHYAAKHLEAGYARRLSRLKGTKLAKTAGLVLL